MGRNSHHLMEFVARGPECRRETSCSLHVVGSQQQTRRHWFMKLVGFHMVTNLCAELMHSRRVQFMKESAKGCSKRPDHDWQHSIQ